MMPPHSTQRGSASPSSTRASTVSVGQVVLQSTQRTVANVTVNLGDHFLGQPRLDVEPVDVLSYASVELLGAMEINECEVRSIRLQRSPGSPQLSFGMQLPTALAALGIAEVFLDGEVGRIHLGPQPVGTPKVGHPGFGRDTGAGESQDRQVLAEHLGGEIDRVQRVVFVNATIGSRRLRPSLVLEVALVKLSNETGKDFASFVALPIHGL